MIKLRANLAKSIESAIQSGGSGGVGGQTVSKEEFEKVQAENKKLKYRVKHLLRALDAQEGGSSGSGGEFTLYTIEDSVQLNQIKVVASFVGVSLKIVNLDEEQRSSKEHKNKNPTGKYPLLETKEGTLSGVIPITKFLAKKSSKLLGDGSPLSQSKVDQWSFWCVS